MKSLVALLKKTAGLKGWQVSRLSKNSTEVYYVGRELETVRCNAVSNYTLRVQTPCEDNFMGESATRFQGKPVSLNALVEETKERAELVKNPAYRFAESSPLLSAIHPPIDDIQIRNADLDTLIAVGVKAQEYRQKHLARFPLNSLELFFEEYTLDIQNHRGLICHTPSTRLVCDYVLTSPDNAHEIMGIKKRRFLSDLCIEEEWENDARILSDLTQATLPPTGNFPVLLSGDALDSLYDFFLAQLDGHALFNRYSLFEKGDAVVRDAKESLTIFSTPAIEGGMRSYAFDDLGFPIQEVCLIRDAHVENFLIDGRYADLLKMPATSALANVRVAHGSTPYADFLSDGVLELSKFSTFQPNTVSGAFSGEIRLGYWHKNGRKIPIKGGSVSGSTQSAFARAYKSREEVKRASYLGPKGVFFENLTVAGS